MADLPVACTLSPAALQARRENLLDALLRRTKERRELPNGYSVRFAAERDVLSEIARMVDNERQCCRFLRFAVTVEPDDAISRSRTGRDTRLRYFPKRHVAIPGSVFEMTRSRTEVPQPKSLGTSAIFCGGSPPGNHSARCPGDFSRAPPTTVAWHSPTTPDAPAAASLHANPNRPAAASTTAVKFSAIVRAATPYPR